MGMLEIIYRIYEVCEKGEEQEIQFENWNDTWKNNDGKHIICQEVLICESRQRFKEIIQDLYEGEDIKFKASKNYPIGQKYCVIISEQCWNTESYTTVVQYYCDYCNIETQALSKHVHSIDEHTLKYELGGCVERYGKLRFCCVRCKNKGIEKAKKEYNEERGLDDNFNGWINTSTLSADKGGYIYKITKRDTNEFYVGQSIHVPVFRWGQHLKTSRFPLSDIKNYIFEVIESVDDIAFLNDREKYWIQHYYKQNPEKSLNVSLTKNVTDNNE